MGEFETTLGHIVGSRGSVESGVLTLPGQKTKRGVITVVANELKEGGNDLLRIAFSGVKLDKKDWFGTRSHGGEVS